MHLPFEIRSYGHIVYDCVLSIVLNPSLRNSAIVALEASPVFVFVLCVCVCVLGGRVPQNIGVAGGRKTPSVPPSSPHLRVCSLILETQEGKEKHQCEKNIDWLPPTCISTGDQSATRTCSLMGNQTHNILVQGKMLQPTEPPGQGWKSHISKQCLYLENH